MNINHILGRTITVEWERIYEYDNPDTKMKGRVGKFKEDIKLDEPKKVVVEHYNNLPAKSAYVIYAEGKNYLVPYSNMKDELSNIDNTLDKFFSLCEDHKGLTELKQYRTRYFTEDVKIAVEKSLFDIEEQILNFNKE